MRKVGDAVIRIRTRILTIEQVNVVARDASQYFRNTLSEFAAFARRDRFK